MKRPSSIQRLVHRLRGGEGLPWLAGAIRDRILPPRLSMAPMIRTGVNAAHGLEIGGRSPMFEKSGLVPVYEWAARIDNVNFAGSTAWESDLRDGAAFRFHAAKQPGTQWICEAGALKAADAAYDFVVSSHCLEHLANPLAALAEWWRVTRPGGHLLLIVPDPTRSFDHRRPVTLLTHLQDDRARGVGEDDTTHVAEVLAAHDRGRDPAAGTSTEFAARVARNHENRCLHHHVFDPALVREALQETGWQVLAQERVRPVHLVAWARKEAP